MFHNIMLENNMFLIMFHNNHIRKQYVFFSKYVIKLILCEPQMLELFLITIKIFNFLQRKI